MRKRGNQYECTICGEKLEVARHAKTREVIAGRSGEPTYRTLLVDGVEVHRCALKVPKDRL